MGRIKSALKAFLFVTALLAFLQSTADAVTYETWGVSGRLMRATQDNGDIYEYLDENWNSQGYGRISLIYKSAASNYATYAWGASQVTMNEYSSIGKPLGLFE